jgi:conjugative transfer signal peptidase TraF
VTHRAIPLACAAVGLLLVLLPKLLAPRPLLVWNAAASLPRGIYRITASGALRPGDLVLARTPSEWASMFAARGYLPESVPLLKRVAATAGSTVCRHGAATLIDGTQHATAQDGDRAGRPMPAWSGCHTLGAGELFLLIAEHPASLDGRYFGPTPANLVIGRATPLWTVPDGP